METSLTDAFALEGLSGVRDFTSRPDPDTQLSPEPKPDFEGFSPAKTVTVPIAKSCSLLETCQTPLSGIHRVLATNDRYRRPYPQTGRSYLNPQGPTT